MKLPRFFPILLAAVTSAAPLAANARDKNHGGHRHHGHGGGHGRHYNHGHHHHNHSYNYGRGYYGYGRGYYGYGRGYYGYPYYYGPSLGLSFYSRPSTIYRGRAYSSYSDSLAVDVQRELRRRGYYRGAIDGDIGPGSRSAIARYQRDRGLSVTGRIDSALLRSLGVG